MSKRNRNKSIAEENTAVLMEAVDTTDVVVTTPVEQTTDQVPVDYKFLIEYIVRNGIPEKYFDPKFKFTWQNSTVEVDIRDCDILKCLGYPTETNERRTEFAVPQYLNLANKPVYLPCTIDGVYKVEIFQHRKGIELFRNYIRKLNEYVDDMNSLIKFIFENQADVESLNKIKDSFISGTVKL